MVRHLIAGIHKEYFWAMLAYLAAALLALAAAALPRRCPGVPIRAGGMVRPILRHHRDRPGLRVLAVPM